MAAVHLEIISREIIKPSSPTPPHLSSFNLSFFDRSSSPMYVPLVLFYNPSNNSSPAEISNLLKKSLSETLTLYYPFAGKVKDREHIDCNDEGIVFVEAKIKSKLSEFLKNPKADSLDLLFADNLQWEDTNLSTSVAAQVSFFECGGMAISACMSHKIGDAVTLVTFINDWAAKASNSSKQVSPMFNTTSMFSQGDLPVMPEHVAEKGNYSSRRFVFDALKISALKSKVTDKVKNPTRVEVVSALLYKCAISASKASSGGTKRPTLLRQSINVRPRLIPPLPENFVGNLGWFFPVSTTEDSETELHSFVGQIKEALAEFCNTYANKFRGEEWELSIRENLEKSKKLVRRSNQVHYVCSSWCRFPIYQADFGWGRPVWASIGSCLDKNVFILMDNKSGDAIEAYVTLEEEDMAAFERDEDLLAFATFNPTPLGYLAQ